VVFTCLLAAAAAAETLDEAWQAALAAEPALEAARARTLAASSALDAARAEYRPVLTLSTAASRWRDTPAFDFSAIGVPFALPLFGGSTLSLAEIRAEMPIYAGGALDANVVAAAAAVSGGEYATAGLVQDVKLAVAAAYVEVLRTDSALAVARANTASLEAHARDVADMQRAGQVPRNDYLAAAVTLADAKQRELERENGSSIARAAYNRALRRPLDARVEIDPLPPVQPETDSLEALVGAALATRPELMGLEAAAAELDARATAARAARRPQVAVQGGYTFIENDVLDREDYWSLGIGVEWRPFDGGRARHAAAAFSQRSSAASHDREGLRSAIELDVRRAWLDASAAHARVAVTESALAQAEENVAVVRDRYRSGEGTNTEVLDAEALRVQSLGNFDNARYDAALAELRLSRALGRL
jgi:outer membrane protein TolC